MTTARVVSVVLVYCTIGVLVILAADYVSRWGR